VVDATFEFAQLRRARDVNRQLDTIVHVPHLGPRRFDGEWAVAQLLVERIDRSRRWRRACFGRSGTWPTASRQPEEYEDDGPHMMRIRRNPMPKMYRFRTGVFGVPHTFGVAALRRTLGDHG
jgi:hypothetical protein